MPVLYLTEHGAYVRKHGDRVRVEKEGVVLAEMPFERVESVCLFGNIQLSTQVMEEFLERGIETAFFSAGGRLRGQLTPAVGRNSELRFRQYAKAQDTAACLVFSRRLVTAKIANSIRLLKRYQRAHAEAGFNAEVDALEARLKDAEAADTVDSLRGVEGAAAAVYWTCFARMLRHGPPFTKRAYHPCTDPVNALLSFGYTLVDNEIRSLLDGLGFDPYVGFYHVVEYGRPSLALDLIEEYRAAVVDRFVLYLFNNRILNEADFEKIDAGEVRLKPEPRKRFLLEYERHMNRPFRDPDYPGAQSYRTIFRLQAHRLQHWIIKDVPYEPYSFDID